MIWRSRRGWVLDVGGQFFVVSGPGCIVERYGPASFSIGDETHVVDQFVTDGQLIARTRIGARVHATSLLEDDLVADTDEEIRTYWRQLLVKLTLPMPDVSRPEPVPPLFEHLREAERVIADPVAFAQVASRRPPNPMIWRTPRGWVLRMGEQFFVVNEIGAVLERYQPTNFVLHGRTYWVDHFVKRRSLFARTAADERWGKDAYRRLLEYDLQPDISQEVRTALRAMPSLHFFEAMLDELDRGFVPREARGKDVVVKLEPAPEPVEPPPPQVVLAMDQLRLQRDKLCQEILQVLHGLTHHPRHTYAAIAMARASLLLLHDHKPPVIDETWVPIKSPFAERVAMLVDKLDERGHREAADAMETSAALLGYRDGFPVARA